MTTPTSKIKLNVTGAEVEIKEWITGAEAEYIDEALFAGVEVKPDIATRSAKIGNFDTKALNNQVHRELEKFVVAIDGKAENLMDEILTLPEEDYNQLKAEVLSRRGKKKVKEGGQPAPSSE